MTLKRIAKSIVVSGPVRMSDPGPVQLVLPVGSESGLTHDHPDPQPWLECVVLAKLYLLFSKAEERGILLYANWFCMHCFMIEISVVDPDPDILIGPGAAF